MDDLLIPAHDVTFTLKSAPRRDAERKTIERLARRQPDITRTLKMLQHRRRKVDNKTYIRAGVEWTNRKRATRPERAEVGMEFTIRITPQIIPDIKSVGKYLDARKA